MKREDKELLLKDLCARLPYGVKASYYGKEEERETWDEIEGITCDGYVDIGQYGLPIERIKPYLFPLSSMTEEQENQLKEIWGADMDKAIDYSVSGEERLSSLCELSAARKVIDWLNKNHFDYRGLIEKGLAIDATNLNIY